MPRYCAVEGGGTTWVAAISVGNPDNITERVEVSKTIPPSPPHNLTFCITIGSLIPNHLP